MASDDEAPSHEIFQSEWAISRILSNTDPRTACLLAPVSTTFLAASNSDLAWTPFLPPNSLPRLLHSHDTLPTSKKEAFLRLTRSITLRDGTQMYWLDRRTGAECFMLSARALQIAWGNDPRYWRWIPCDGAWFPEVAYLRSVCWFQIRGTFREVLTPGRYTVSFRLQTGVDKGDSDADTRRPRRPIWRRGIWRREQDRPEGRRNLWGEAPAKVLLRTSLGEEVTREVRLGEEGCLEKSQAPAFAASRGEWMECHAGEFLVEDDGACVEVEFAMEEIEVLAWKQGVLLDGVLRPSFCVPPHSQILHAEEVEEGEGLVSAPNIGEMPMSPIPQGQKEEEEEEEESASAPNIGEMPMSSIPPALEQHPHDNQEEMRQTLEQIEMCGVPPMAPMSHFSLAHSLQYEEVCGISNANAHQEEEMIRQGPEAHEQADVSEETSKEATQCASTSP